MASRAPGKARGWVAGTVLLALVMAAAAWSFVISPVRAQTAEAMEETESIRAANSALQSKINQLRVQFAEIDDYKAELDALRIQIPTEADLTDYFREVSAVADASGVVIVNMTSDLGTALVPAVVAPAAPEEPAPPATGTEAPEESGEPPATDDATQPAGPPILEGFVGIPVSVTAVGDYAAAVAFTVGMQTGTSRLFLVTQLTAKALKDADAGGGRPATVVGDMEMQLTGVVFVLVSDYQTSGTDEPEDPEEPVGPTPLPPAVPGKNPLIPVGAPPEA